MRGTAEIGADGRYRWRLDREWGIGDRVLWLMLNPSTADATANDPTIRKCIGFTERWGFGALTVCNVAPHRATDPRDMKRMVYEDGQDGRDWKGDNLSWIAGAREGAALVVAAWGAHVVACDLEEEALDLAYEQSIYRDLHCLGLTAGGFPRHPLMLAYATPLVVFRERLRAVAP